MDSLYYTRTPCAVCMSSNCLLELNPKTGENFIVCPDCGYYFVLQYKRDPDGNLVKADETAPATPDNLIPVHEVCKTPYGVFCIEYANGSSTRGTLRDFDEYIKFRDIVDQIKKAQFPGSMLHEEVVTDITISRYVDNRIVKSCLYNLYAI